MQNSIQDGAVGLHQGTSNRKDLNMRGAEIV